jgi:hypothetical protein
MTPLAKPITRRSEERVREAGKSRRIVVTLYPNGLIGLRPERTRREETVPIDVIYLKAVKARVLAERAAKRRRP